MFDVQMSDIPMSDIPQEPHDQVMWDVFSEDASMEVEDCTSPLAASNFSANLFIMTYIPIRTLPLT